MAIKEFEFYHGAALLRLTSSFDDGAWIVRRNDIGAGCYALDGEVGLYVKYSTARMTPWQFSFAAAHVAVLVALRKHFRAVFVILVCGGNSVVTINGTDAERLIGNDSTGGWLSVRRKPRQMCAVSGTRGDLPNRIADSDFTDVHEALRVSYVTED
jgi:hypothetical protein